MVKLNDIERGLLHKAMHFRPDDEFVDWWTRHAWFVAWFDAFYGKGAYARSLREEP